jgi:tetratricopeptide (TPR) repeat protein
MTHDELTDLILRHFDGDTSEDEQRRLAAVLKDDHAARALFARLMRFEAVLADTVEASKIQTYAPRQQFRLIYKLIAATFLVGLLVAAAVLALGRKTGRVAFRTVSVMASANIRPDRAITGTGGGCVVEFDSCKIELYENTELEIRPDGSLALRKGKFRFESAPGSDERHETQQVSTPISDLVMSGAPMAAVLELAPTNSLVGPKEMLCVTMNSGQARLWKKWTVAPGQSVVLESGRTPVSHVAWEHKVHGDEQWQKQPELAISEYTHAIEIEPEFTSAIHWRGLVYNQLKPPRRDLALADFSRAIALDPKEAAIYSQRSVIYTMSGNYDGAIDDLTKVIELTPDKSHLTRKTGCPAYYSRALAYFQKNELDPALADIDLSLSVAKEDYQNWQLKAQILVRKGNKVQALECYDLAIRYCDDPPHLQEIEGERQRVR